MKEKQQRLEEGGSLVGRKSSTGSTRVRGGLTSATGQLWSLLSLAALSNHQREKETGVGGQECGEHENMQALVSAVIETG